MKKIFAQFALSFAATSILCAQDHSAPQFPNTIEFEVGALGFRTGDNIAITAVRGNRPHLEAGGSYEIEGTCTLQTFDRADLALYCTTRGPGGPTPTQEGEITSITRGTSHFLLYETNIPDGWLHISFYPHGDSQGGVYFGEKGREKTINRHQEWYRNLAGNDPEKKSDASHANSILYKFLGDPVKPPSDLDARYSKAGLSNALQTAAQNAGIIPRKTFISDLEFPFLVGAICRGSDFKKLKVEINKMDGYHYGGSVGKDDNSDGSDTCNAFSIVPYEACPAALRFRIQHRLMLRYQVFFDEISAEK
jgi:hypothetical protein